MTPRQRAALAVILDRQRNGAPGPTLDEIAAELGVCRSRVVALIDSLERAGAVTWPKAQGRRVPRWIRAAVGTGPAG